MTEMTRFKTILFALASASIGCLALLVALEVALRFLPVNGGLMSEPVDAGKPVRRFTPNREITWSRGWNFSIVNRIRVNNAGYVNNQDYFGDDPKPLIAVVGDSYVEAAMVPYADTLHGRLAASLAPRARVYSFAASGAPLSQYVVWAREAREIWKATALIVVVVGNDFDESLAAVKQGPGFHHYERNPEGALELRRFDYRPNPMREVVRASALSRYLFFNLQVLHHAARVKQMFSSASGVTPQQFAGNTAVSADAERLSASREAISAFLRDTVAVAGWRPEQVLFLLDGFRVPGNALRLERSYFAQMRTHFMQAARAAGFEVLDLDPAFFAAWRTEGGSFDFPTDGHWNARAHGIAADAARGSALVKGLAQPLLP
jgi:hypothetical protein